MNKLVYILLFLICSKALGQAQLLGLNDGLSNKEVTAILQDRSGFLWVGTANGLNRYDGYAFREFNKNNGLSSGKIKCLYEDRNGFLWIGTWEGLDIMDLKTGRISSFFDNRRDNKGRILSSEICFISPLADGSVLVSLGDGLLMRFTDRTHYDEIYRFSEKDTTYRRQIVNIVPAPDGSIFISTDYAQLRKLTPLFMADSKFTLTEEVLTVAPGLKPGSITLVDYFGKVSEASLLNGKVQKQLTARRLKTENGAICAFYQEGAEIWLSFSTTGLFRVNLLTGASRDYTAELGRALIGAATTIFRDRSGILWIGSSYGLVRFSPRNQLFENHLRSRDETFQSKNSIRGMVQDEKGDIYIGGYNGLFKMQPATGEIKHFTFGKPGTDAYKTYYPYRLVDDGDVIWMTSETEGFLRFDKHTQQIDFPAGDLKPGPFFRATGLLADGKDSLWIGTHNGLFIYSRKTGQLSKYKDRNGGFDLGNIEISDLALDPRGNLYIGGYSAGLFRLSKVRGITRHFSVADSSLPLNFITDLFSENDSTLWVGTRGAGLLRLNPMSGRSKLYTKRTGLADNSIAAVVKDKGGVLWVSTFNGLSRLGANGQCTNYYEKDGITDNEFNIAAHLLAANGKIYLGGLNGLNAFYPADLEKSARPAQRIFLTRFMKYDPETNAQVEVRLPDAGEQLSFSASEKFFSFSFSLDDYYHPARNAFSFFLEGYDQGWTNIGTQNTVRFNSLPAGSYTLHIRSTNPEGIASANELTIPLQISQPFYTAWWFYLLILILTVCTVFLVTRYFIYQRLKIHQLRTKISSDLHDEVGGLLTRISIQAELLKQDLPQSGAMQEIDVIAKTSRQATAAMSDVLWSIDARNDTMGNLIDKLREHSGEILFPLETEIDFTVKNIGDARLIDSFIRQQLFLIFKEAVNNIARHAQATRVEIKLENLGDQFLMKISDNGSSLPKESVRQGQGLRNMRMRAEKLGGNLSTGHANGFFVTLTMKKFC